MKKIMFFAVMCSIMVLTGCDSSVIPSSKISDCHPNTGELKPVKHMMSPIEDNESDLIPEIDTLDYSEVLTVRCTGEKRMQIIRHDPHFTCCMTPQNSIIRTGYTITIDDWDIGLTPCNCECPRNIESTMSNLPYGTYTFSLKHGHKEMHSVDLDFVPELDTMIVWKAW